MNDHKRLIQVLEVTIKDGKSLIVDYEKSIAEMEYQLQETKARLVITQTAQVALVEKLHELTKHSPEASEAERKPPQMPEGRVVVNHAISIKRDASECILMLFEADPIPHTVARIAAEVYGDASPRNIKRAQMRIHALKGEGRVTSTPPLLASTLVHKVP